MATRIGVDNLVYSLMTTEDSTTAAPVYATPVTAPGVMSVNVNPNAAQETLFADNGPFDAASTIGKIEVEIKKAELTVANKGDLLGHMVDTNGGLVYGDSDTPPWCAVGFRTLKSNGKVRCTWMYKGKFMDPEDQNETKGDNISFQADTIKGSFVKLNYAYTMTKDTVTKTVRPWKYDLDEEAAGVLPATLANFFTKVAMPNATVA